MSYEQHDNNNRNSDFKIFNEDNNDTLREHSDLQPKTIKSDEEWTEIHEKATKKMVDIIRNKKLSMSHKNVMFILLTRELEGIAFPSNDLLALESDVPVNEIPLVLNDLRKWNLLQP